MLLAQQPAILVLVCVFCSTRYRKGTPVCLVFLVFFFHKKSGSIHQTCAGRLIYLLESSLMYVPIVMDCLESFGS